MNKAYSSVKDLKKGMKVYLVLGKTIFDAVVSKDVSEVTCATLKPEHKYQTLVGGMTSTNAPVSVDGNATLELTTRDRVALRTSLGEHYVCDTILNDSVFIFDNREMAKSQVKMNDRSLIQLQKRCSQRMRAPAAREAVRRFGYD